ncbi:DinB family protein [Fodinibius sp.]|uniref:DinB family protein n=1 Tax=Fodinibius sp. TaxID=1872440 RepID=UPI002ACE867F|nr:DinB family protein [Fodinibius sp.]MDZ7660405.1 DinB family protein [Fodinibius sp.]
MESADHLLRLFEYDNWANEQILLSLQDNLSFEESEKAVEYLAHIAGSQQMWLHRIKGKSLGDIKIWPDYGLPEALQNLKTLNQQWKQLISTGQDNLDKIISYTNSKGISYETTLSDILYHVIIHGQHHRAQIAKLLRNANIDPPATDFIFFTRTN